MKIIIIAYRHWTAGREYRSLALNAKRLGHQVWGFSEVSHKDAPLTIAAFEELGIKAYPGEELKGRIDEIDPDVVFGGRMRKRFPVERFAQEWVNAHNKVGFLYHHYIIFEAGCETGYNPGPRTHLSCTNEAQREACTSPECESAWEEPSVWPKEQVHVLGAPGFDVAFEPVDVDAVRRKLGVKLGQPLIGLFPNIRNGHRPLPPSKDVLVVVQAGIQRGWKMVLHPYPLVRRLQYSDSKSGFFNCKLDDIEYDVPEFLLKLQEEGAVIVADYAPGTMLGVRFERCGGFELHAAADCLLSGSIDPAWEAYAIGKRCHPFNGLRDFDLCQPSTSIHDLGAFRVMEPIIDRAFEESFDNDVDKIAAVLKRGPDRIEQDPKAIKEFLYKLDGLWWQRALNLAASLRES